MKPMVHLVVLGSGMIGRTIALLAANQDWDVVVVDPFNQVLSAKYDSIKYDGFNYVAENNFAKGTYFVNTMPVYEPEKVVGLIKRITELEGHYLDISEDFDCMNAIRSMFREHTGTLIAPHCGLAPGMTTVMAANMMSEFGHVENVRINVGALALNVDNEFGYVPTWSPEGLVNEYSNNNLAIVNGVATERVPDFSNVDQLVLDGATYESCPTSGGLGTMAYSVHERNAKNLNGEPICYTDNLEYRTIRYIGHWETISAYLYPPSPENRNRLLMDVSRYMTDQSQTDVVLIHIEVTGTKPAFNSPTVTNRYTKMVFGETPMLAIQETTAKGPLLVIDSHAKKLLPSRYLAQEDIRLTDGVKNSPFYYM